MTKREEVKRMNEKDERKAGALPKLQPDLEYIPVCSDPRGFYDRADYQKRA